MATQTGSIDLRAAKKAHDDAAKTATNFISANDEGIMVYDGENGTSYTPSTAPTGVKNVFIDDGSVNVRDGQTVLTEIADKKIYLGALDSSASLHLSNEKIEMLTKQGSPFFSLDTSEDTVENTIILSTDTTGFLGNAVTAELQNLDKLTVGDVITVPNLVTEWYFNSESSGVSMVINSASASSGTATIKTTDGSLVPLYFPRVSWQPTSDYTFVYGTSSTKSITITASYTTDSTRTVTLTVQVSYNASTNVITITPGVSGTIPSTVSISPIANGSDYIYAVAENVNAPYFTLGTRVGDAGGLSMTSGLELYASKPMQSSFGKYNVEDTANKYAMMVGNGTGNLRSNAMAVGWDGNYYLALDTSVGSGTDYELYSAIVALGWQNDVIV